MLQPDETRPLIGIISSTIRVCLQGKVQVKNVFVTVLPWVWCSVVRHIIQENNLKSTCGRRCYYEDFSSSQSPFYFRKSLLIFRSMDITLKPRQKPLFAHPGNFPSSLFCVFTGKMHRQKVIQCFLVASHVQTSFAK